MAREVETPVRAVRVEMRCDCGGTMVASGLTHAIHPPRYEHHCDRCRRPCSYDRTYPRIEYREVMAPGEGSGYSTPPEIRHHPEAGATAAVSGGRLAPDTAPP